MCVTIETKRVRIRKERPCFGCERVIPKGTLMHAHKTRGDGRIYTLHLCSRCDEAHGQLDDCDDVYWQGELKDRWVDGN